MRDAATLAGACLGVLLVVMPALAQAPDGAGLKPAPGTFGAAADDDFRRPRAEHLSSKAFTVDLQPDVPVRVVGVTEQRQITLDRPLYAVTARNVSAAVVKGYTVAAVVVGRDGTTKGVQRLPRGSGLKPSQARKQDTQVRVAVPSVSDRLAFVVVDVELADGERWTVDDARLQEALRLATAPER
jgi:hypothetical protein